MSTERVGSAGEKTREGGIGGRTPKILAREPHAWLKGATGALKIILQKIIIKRIIRNHPDPSEIIRTHPPLYRSGVR